MTTSATIQSLWGSNVFANATITAISANAYGFIVEETSEAEIQTMSEAQAINYFEYLVSREVVSREVGGASNAILRFTVEVRYTKQIDTEGDAHQDVRDAFETLITTVETELGTTWDGNIDFYTHQDGAPEVSAVSVADTPCYRGTYKFFGTQAASL